MSSTEQGADYVSTIVKTCSRHTPVAVLSFRKPVLECWSPLVVVRAWCETSLYYRSTCTITLPRRADASRVSVRSLVDDHDHAVV